MVCSHSISGSLLHWRISGGSKTFQEQRPDASGGRFTSRRGSAAAFRKPNIAVSIDLTKRHSRVGSSILLEAARKLVEYRAELRREERKKGLKRRQRRRFSVSTELRNRGTQAFWAMHVEAMNWSGMGVRECAAALRLSPYALPKWRDADLARCFALRRSRDRSSRGCRRQRSRNVQRSVSARLSPNILRYSTEKRPSSTKPYPSAVGRLVE